MAHHKNKEGKEATSLPPAPSPPPSSGAGTFPAYLRDARGRRVHKSLHLRNFFAKYNTRASSVTAEVSIDACEGIPPVGKPSRLLRFATRISEEGSRGRGGRGAQRRNFHSRCAKSQSSRGFVVAFWRSCNLFPRLPLTLCVTPCRGKEASKNSLSRRRVTARNFVPR